MKRQPSVVLEMGALLAVALAILIFFLQSAGLLGPPLAPPLAMQGPARPDPASLDAPEPGGEGGVYPGPLRIARRPGLTAEQRGVEEELVHIVQDAARADAQYDALPFTRGGRLLSMDHARYLSPQYATAAQRLVNTPATRNAAAAYVKNRLRRALEKGPPGSRLLLGSGGPGSGKTTLIARLLDGEWEGRFANATLVFDCTLSHLGASSRTLDVFLAHGWAVDVVHVYRPYSGAVRGVLDRAGKEGRYVGLGPGRSMSSISHASQDVFYKLHEAYGARASFFVFSASTPGRVIRQLAVESIGPQGSHRHEPEQLVAIENRVIAEFLAGGGSPKIVHVSLHGMTGTARLPNSSEQPE